MLAMSLSIAPVSDWIFLLELKRVIITKLFQRNMFWKSYANNNICFAQSINQSINQSESIQKYHTYTQSIISISEIFFIVFNQQIQPTNSFSTKT